MAVIESSFPPIEVPLISISKLLIDRMRYFGDKVFLTEYNTERSFTFSRLAEDCLRMSKVWLDLGLKSKQIFGVCGDNSYEYMVCLLSGIFIGAIAVPMRGNDTIEELKRTIKEREIKNGIVFGDCSGCEEETHFSIYECLIQTTEPISVEQIYEPKDVREEICLILESSGTTGLPKGCMFSHYNLVALITIGSTAQAYNRTSDDIVSGHGFTAHISGVNQLIMSIKNGSQLILHPNFNLNTFYEAIEKYKITALSAPASVFLNLLKNGTKHDIRSLKKVICGGAPLPKGCAKTIVEKYPHLEDFRQGYGMTEMTILIAFGEYGSKAYDSVGAPTPGNKIKVIDCKTGQILSHNQTGELCVTGPTLFKGYHNNSIATKETIDCDNYLHSGDLGHYDTNGNLYIVDRIKLLLKTDGMQVSPTELETLFLTHRAVSEVAVIGKPDEISGQLPNAFVVIKHQYKDNIDCNELLQFVNSQITPLKRIRGIHIINEMPKNKSSKIDRNKLLIYLNNL